MPDPHLHGSLLIADTAQGNAVLDRLKGPADGLWLVFDGLIAGAVIAAAQATPLIDRAHALQVRLGLDCADQAGAALAVTALPAVPFDAVFCAPPTPARLTALFDSIGLALRPTPPAPVVSLAACGSDQARTARLERFLSVDACQDRGGCAKHRRQ